MTRTPRYLLALLALSLPFTISAQSSPIPFLRGGDISMLSLVEDNGGRFYDAQGNERECLELLAENGFNTVRLRLYNDPGNPDYSPSSRLPSGYQDEADVLKLARRAKEANQQIVFSFHYSDYWTNGETQTKPHEWANLSFVQLRLALEDYTKAFLQKMEEQGTLPEYVVLGNETQAGMLYPEGSYQNMSQLAALYNAGYRAVKAVSEDIKVVIHLDNGGDETLYKWYLGELAKYNVRYDVIGASYYPFWTNRTIEQVSAWATLISHQFDRPILIMETGYAWQENRSDGWPGQLYHNLPYTDCTPEGQRAFLEQLIRAIEANESLIGLLYWDPIFIPSGTAGWETGGKNVVENSTLFDFKGKALPALSTFSTDPPSEVKRVHSDEAVAPVEVYDLHGRPVNGPIAPWRTGLYVVNGRKVWVR